MGHGYITFIIIFVCLYVLLDTTGKLDQTLVNYALMDVLNAPPTHIFHAQVVNRLLIKLNFILCLDKDA